MSDTLLPAGLFTLIKSAVRELFDALTAPGSSGSQRVAQITGASPGTVSRWRGDGYGELPPLEVIFHLEYVAQRPIVSRVLAELSGHRVTPIADEDAPRTCLVGDLVSIAGSGARVTVALSESLADGVVTPAEAKRVQGKIAVHQDAITGLNRRLAVITATAND